MKDIISIILEKIFNSYPPQYLDTSPTWFMYEEVYGYSFLISLLIPLVILFGFYKIIDIVGGKIWQYIVTVLISLPIVYFANHELVFQLLPQFANQDGFSSYVQEYSFYITIISFISIIIGTIGLRYISTNNRYNPF